MRIVLMLVGFMAVTQASASGRYLTWVDDQGRVHNSFVDNRYTAHQRAAAGNIQRSDRARLNEGEAAVWPGSKSSGESKRRYFTWVDASGNLQNSFYAGQQVQAGGNEILLGTGERSSAYISSDVLEGRDFARDEQDGRYFTWVDEKGRMRNSKVPPKGAKAPTPTLHNGPVNQGWEVTLEAKPPPLPGPEGQPPAGIQAL